MSKIFEFSAAPRWVWVYNFDENNVFTGTLNFYVAPHTGLPANSTTTKCSPKNGQAGVWDGEKWQYIDDFRGTAYWNSHGKKYVMMELAPLPDGAVTTAPPEAEPGHVLLYTDGEWQQLADRSGQTYYTADGHAQTVPDAYFGLPEGCTFTPPTTPYDHWDGEKWVTDESRLHAAQVDAAKDEISQRLSAAANAIAPLQDAVDMGIATNAEQAMLTSWKQYRVALSRIDADTAPDIAWPERP